MRKKRPLVVYHDRCFDGFTGAWAAWKKFGEAAEYLAVQHQEPPPAALQGRDLYFIDFCYQRSVMKKLKERVGRVVVLDHHVSQSDAIRVADEYVFDVERSGCGIAWEYFHRKKALPFLVRIVQDNDLHAFKVQGTKALIALISGAPPSFGQWDTYAQQFENKKKRALHVQQGRLLLAYKDRLIERLLEFAEKVTFERVAAYALNASVFYSDAANALFERYGVHMGITWFYRDGKIHVSLRSDKSIDVSVLAKKYGGGGHRGASGFSFPATENFPWKRKRR